MQKYIRTHINIVDLDKNFPMSIYLQNRRRYSRERESQSHRFGSLGKHRIGELLKADLVHKCSAVLTFSSCCAFFLDRRGCHLKHLCSLNIELRELRRSSWILYSVDRRESKTTPEKVRRTKATSQRWARLERTLETAFPTASTLLHPTPTGRRSIR